MAGRRFPRDGARPCSTWSEPEAALDTLVRSRASSPRRPTTCCSARSHSYRHALLRDAGYASLARAERGRLLHVRLAEWLAGRGPSSRGPTLAEVIARHYAAALEGAPSLARDIGGLGATRCGRAPRTGSSVPPRLLRNSKTNRTKYRPT